ncbi:hypothetical protein RN001_003546 [Aquatica leii]|uniref:Uncharacterized protein n=1 Tax=Aquatica leii TaxID=1421715 RepID=A0AAN7PF78_9COLE|nr:hypothetical protein RN001_003546 [Aquatica leii]
MKCREKISAEDRRKFFKHYWHLGNYNVQTSFLCACIKEEKAKRKNTTAKNPAKRAFSRVYSINKAVVCRGMFIKTLRISKKRINAALHKVRTLETLDRRGIVTEGHNKISMNQKNDVIGHISKFPRCISHYCRKKKKNKMSFASYKKPFLTEFNLKFKKTKKDTCNKCDTYAAKIKNLHEGNEKEIASLEHKMHLEEAEKARNSMNIDLKNARENDATETLTYDMEKTLPLPRQL